VSLITRLFGSKIDLAPDVETRLKAWQALGDVGEQFSLSESTFIIVDVETSGLNPRRDRLLAIGACVLQGSRLLAGNGFERVIYQAQMSSKENILVHGIAPSEQSSGVPVEQALLDFLDFSGKHVLVAYHAVFDRTVLGRATHDALGARLPGRWLDLAHLAPALYPEAHLPLASLDDWLSRFGIKVQTRHRAIDDVLATGELLLILLKRARERGIGTLGALLATAEAQERSTL